MTAPENSKADFRAALGRFPTGVTIVTTLGAEGVAVGVTSSSFNSVSLEPPLVLWSLAKSSTSLPAFRASGRFAVHVLSAAQQPLAVRFASRIEDRFAGVAWRSDDEGLPLLVGCAARFRCRTAHEYEGGDHVIFVGEVLDFDASDAAPLIFHASAYAEVGARLGGK